MSDGTWDIEYSRAENLKEDIIRYCNDNNLDCPIFQNHMRIRDVELIFKKLKLKK